MDSASALPVAPGTTFVDVEGDAPRLVAYEEHEVSNADRRDRESPAEQLPSSASRAETVSPAVTAQHSDDPGVLKQISEDLTCCVCTSILVDPRVLRCQHTFCLRCLHMQTTHDKSRGLELRCIFRCHEPTVLEGDIRTLPRNPVLTSICSTVRGSLMKRLVAQSELDGAAPLECEWCGSSDGTCKVCSYCQSLVCRECAGQFTDHSYLCTALHDESHPEALVHSANDTTAHRHGADSGDDTPAQSVEGGDERAVRGDSGIGSASNVVVYPFFLPPSCLGRCVRNALIKVLESYNAPQLSELKLANVFAAYIGVPVYDIECRYPLTNFSAHYQRASVVTVELGEQETSTDATNATSTTVSFDISADCHFTSNERGAHVFSFITALLRLGTEVVENVNQNIEQIEALQLELSSSARRLLLVHNRGLHLVAVHMCILAKQHSNVVNTMILPQMSNGLMIAAMMGDQVTNRIRQLWLQAGSVEEKRVIRTQYLNFLRRLEGLSECLETQILQLQSVVANIKAKTLKTLTCTLRLALQLKRTRMQEARKQRRSRMASPTLHGEKSTGGPAAPQRRDEEAEGAGAQVDVTASANAPENSVSPDSLAAAAPRQTHPLLADPIHDMYSNRTFAGQFQERQEQTNGMLRAYLLTLEALTKLRTTVWGLSNMTVREYSYSEADRVAILRTYVDIEHQTDTLLHLFSEQCRYLFSIQIFFIHCDELGMEWDLTMMNEALSLLGTGADESETLYSSANLDESFTAHRTMRNRLLRYELGQTQLFVREFSFQEALSTIMRKSLRSVQLFTCHIQSRCIHSETEQRDLYVRVLASLQIPLQLAESVLPPGIPRTDDLHHLIETPDASLLERTSHNAAIYRRASAHLAQFMRQDVVLVSVGTVARALCGSPPTTPPPPSPHADSDADEEGENDDNREQMAETSATDEEAPAENAATSTQAPAETDTDERVAAGPGEGEDAAAETAPAEAEAAPAAASTSNDEETAQVSPAPPQTAPHSISSMSVQFSLVPPPAAYDCREELLFTTDSENTKVAYILPSDGNSQSAVESAKRQFTSDYRLAAQSHSVDSVHTTVVPVYIGDVVFRNQVVCKFIVDAQTSEVSFSEINWATLPIKRTPASLLAMILCSPLFLIAVNRLLSALGYPSSSVAATFY